MPRHRARTSRLEQHPPERRLLGAGLGRRQVVHHGRLSQSSAHLTVLPASASFRAVLEDGLLEDVAYLFSLLSDSTRLRLVRELHESGELTVGELAARTGQTLANASQHLVRLAAAGLIERRRHGKHVLYRVEDPRLEQLCDVMCARASEGVVARRASWTS